MSYHPKTETFTYVCGHEVTVNVDARKHGGGLVPSRIQASIREGRRCISCRRFDVLERLRNHNAVDLLEEFMRRATISHLESIADG